MKKEHNFKKCIDLMTAIERIKKQQCQNVIENIDELINIVKQIRVSNFNTNQKLELENWIKNKIPSITHQSENQKNLHLIEYKLKELISL